MGWKNKRSLLAIERSPISVFRWMFEYLPSSSVSDKEPRYMTAKDRARWNAGECIDSEGGGGDFVFSPNASHVQLETPFSNDSHEIKLICTVPVDFCKIFKLLNMTGILWIIFMPKFSSNFLKAFLPRHDGLHFLSVRKFYFTFIYGSNIFGFNRNAYISNVKTHAEDIALQWTLLKNKSVISTMKMRSCKTKTTYVNLYK